MTAVAMNIIVKMNLMISEKRFKYSALRSAVTHWNKIEEQKN